MLNERSALEELQALLVQRSISRASFLRLLGAGAGLSLVPTSFAALREVSRWGPILLAADRLERSQLLGLGPKLDR